jgi:hypothetical protein
MPDPYECAWFTLKARFPHAMVSMQGDNAIVHWSGCEGSDQGKVMRILFALLFEQQACPFLPFPELRAPIASSLEFESSLFSPASRLIEADVNLSLGGANSYFPAVGTRAPSASPKAYLWHRGTHLDQKSASSTMRYRALPFRR